MTASLARAGGRVYALDGEATYDVLVVGSGVAGMTAALGLASEEGGLRVALVTKTPGLAGGATAWAQGGVAVALAPGDEPGLHAADTLRAAAGTARPALVGLLTREGPARVRQLMERGARFDRGPDGRLLFGREAAHGRARILHARGDATGAEIARALAAAAADCPGIDVLTDSFVYDLLLEPGPAGPGVAGAVLRTPEGELLGLRAPATILATGGIGRLYSRTTNPAAVTGDGLAMAARAGARLADLELVQFHPTALAVDGADPMPLVSEAVRGEGATLVDEEGRRFMPARHPDAELAPRDVVARAIAAEQAAGHRIYLDARAALGARFPERFPGIFARCQAYGVDPRLAPIPVSPAAHYHMGGIDVDADGRASLPGLWACGEAASTGVHGANRLASNSLLEGLVFGARVAEDVLRRATRLPAPAGLALDDPGVGGAVHVGALHGGAAHDAMLDDALAVITGAPSPAFADAGPEAPGLRELAWRELGIVRDEAGLVRAEARMAALSARLPAGEAANLALVGRLVAVAARARRESRGAHRRRDYPALDPAWRRRLTLRLVDGDPRLDVPEALVVAGPAEGAHA